MGSAGEHLYNIINPGLNIHADVLCHIKRKR